MFKTYYRFLYSLSWPELKLGVSLAYARLTSAELSPRLFFTFCYLVANKIIIKKITDPPTTVCSFNERIENKWKFAVCFYKYSTRTLKTVINAQLCILARACGVPAVVVRAVDCWQ